MLIPISIDMGAQGFLKKLQKAVDMVQKTVKEVQKTDEGVTNVEEGNQHNAGEKEQALVFEIPSEYASVPKSNLEDRGRPLSLAKTCRKREKVIRL